MSKTLGNVIDPIDLLNKYGADALRYYFLSQIPPTDDGDFSEEKLKTVYNADLANGLGNLVARVAKLCENSNQTTNALPASFDPELEKLMRNCHFNAALEHLWNEIREADKFVNEQRPWEQNGEDLIKTLEVLVEKIQHVAFNLQPFLPQASEKILDQFSGEIKSSESLFPRKA